jgi:hypothetical protein
LRFAVIDIKYGRTVLTRLCCGVAVLGRLLRVCCVVLRCRGFRGPGERRDTAQNGRPWPRHEQRGPSVRNLLRRAVPGPAEEDTGGVATKELGA